MRGVSNGNVGMADGRKTNREHFIGLVKDEHLHAVSLEKASLDHILDTAGRADDNLRTVLQGLHIVTNTGTTDARMALDAHEVTNGNHHLLDLLGKFAGGGQNQGLALLEIGIDLLEHRDGESGGFTSTRLGLRNDIVACCVSEPNATMIASQSTYP